MYALLRGRFFIARANQALIASVGVLPSGFNVLYNVAAKLRSN
jgi:hypothetical protein